MSLSKKKIIAVICVVSFIGAVFLAISSYVVANDEEARKTDIAETVKVKAVKIPPLIEGLAPLEEKRPQSLDKIDIAILTANGTIHKYRVEKAITLPEISIGMMFRDHIDENTGMLFVFNEEAERNFWMKNTLIPLDILFIRGDGIITHIHHMAKEKSLDRISSNGKVMAVLEIAGGEAEILGINVGDRILYKDF